MNADSKLIAYRWTTCSSIQIWNYNFIFLRFVCYAQSWIAMPKIPAALKATTPRKTSDEILSFCQSIRSDNSPDYVQVQPEEHAIANRCHTNVPTYIEEHGGSKATGWIIWEARYWLEAEFHCNWLSPDGTLIDITPKDDRETRILFLPDDSIEWTGHMILPHRRPRTDNAYLRKWASLQGERDKIRSNYRVDESLSNADIHRLEMLTNRANTALTGFHMEQKQREKNRRKKKRKR